LSPLRDNVTPYLGPEAFVESTSILWKIDQYGAFEGMIIQKRKPKYADKTLSRCHMSTTNFPGQRNIKVFIHLRGR